MLTVVISLSCWIFILKILPTYRKKRWQRDNTISWCYHSHSFSFSCSMFCMFHAYCYSLLLEKSHCTAEIKDVYKVRIKMWLQKFILRPTCIYITYRYTKCFVQHVVLHHGASNLLNGVREVYTFWLSMVIKSWQNANFVQWPCNYVVLSTVL